MSKVSAQPINSALDTALLNRIQVNPESGIPLHAQVRQGLLALINSHFETGAAFFSEKSLTDHLPVSQITVSRALQDLQREGILYRSRGRGTTIARRASGAAGQTGLHNRTAAAIKTIGLCVLSCGTDYVSDMAERLAAACHERRLDFRIYYCRTGQQLPDVLRQATREPQEEAFVTMVSGDVAPQMTQALRQRGFRCVALEGVADSFAGSLVVTDARAAIQVGLEHLFDLGHYRIALLVNEPLSDPSVVQKLAEFHRVMRARGLAGSAFPILCDTSVGQSSFQTAYAHMEEVWSLKPTAIFAVSDPGAWAAIKWLTEHGISIPGEVSVLGFEDARPSRFLHPTLSTVAHPLERRARRALEILCDEPADLIFHEALTPKLVVRESTGPAPD